MSGNIFPFTDFHFLRPLWLLAIPVLLFLGITFWQRMLARSVWRRVCDAQLLSHLLDTNTGTRTSMPLALLCAGLCIASIALAGPSFRTAEMPVFKSQQSHVIVLDLSRSMAVPDLKPSRLARAQFKAADLLQLARAGQVGLIAFAGDAFMVAPLTQDADTLLNLLPALDVDSMPVQGSAPELGLKLAQNLLMQAGAKTGHVFLLTDGAEDLQPLNESARALNHAGYQTSVLAIGTASGAPIPLPNGGFVKDEQGAIVIPTVDFEGLAKVAADGGGYYTAITNDGKDVAEMFAAANSLGVERSFTPEQRLSSRWRDEGPWLTLLLLPLAAFAFRRGWLVTITAVAIGIGTPQPAQALDWEALFLRPDQRAARALAQARDTLREDARALTQTQQDALAKTLQRAIDLAGDANTKASALYYAKRFEEAEQLFAQGDDARASYNRATALAKAGRFKDAISAYDLVLTLNPQHEDAMFNKAIVAKLLVETEKNSENVSAGDAGSSETPSKSSSTPQDQNPNTGGANSSQGQTGKQEATTEGDGASSDSGAASTSYNKEQVERENDAGDKPSNNAKQRSNDEQSESGQALEQWLRRIPDDPGGLLRRKFAKEHQRRADEREQSETPW